MKNVIMGFVGTVLIAIAIFSGLTLTGRNARQTELDSAVSSAAEASIRNLIDGEYKISSDKELSADFTERLMTLLTSKSDIEVNIIKSDYVKGILSVEVVETFKHPIGTTGHVSTSTVCIKDTYENPDLDEMGDRSILTFLDTDGSVYTQYSVCNGDNVIAPTLKASGFSGWKDKETGTTYSMSQIKALVLSKNMTFEPILH